MNSSPHHANRTRIQKLCTLWTHNEDFSKDDVAFNIDRFPELSLKIGSLVQISLLKQGTASRDFHDEPRSTSTDTAKRFDLDKASIARGASALGSGSRRHRRNSVTVIVDENGNLLQGEREDNPHRSYVFVAKPMSSEQLTKYPNLQLSISKTIAKVFGFRDRGQVLVAPAREDIHTASHVEVMFRDEYLARADMWRMASAELNQKTVYKGQKLLFMGTIKATVKNVFVDGRTKHSAYYSATTKPIFRSESARFVLFIQMSREMWDFDTEGAGEIMFNKVTNGFLPELFKRWMRIDARHLVTIILFTRLDYGEDIPANLQESSLPSFEWESLRASRPRDLYRVVVSDMASGDWIKILHQLKKEFRSFLRDVSLIPKDRKSEHIESMGGFEDTTDRLMIAGKPVSASKGNILEAINLAVSQFSKDYIDRDLVRTGISIVVITPGTGVFEVDYNMLKLTTDTLVGTGIGIDLVCLSPMPLHSVPLFMYRNPLPATNLLALRNPSLFYSDAENAKAVLEFNDRTPRQNTSMFGRSYGSRTSASGTIVQGRTPPANTDPVPGEWSYAMPHWIDVSFWSGPSSEIVELSKYKYQSSLSRRERRDHSFTVRCRMYELQMMGLMENELSNISIERMDENWLPSHLHMGQINEVHSTEAGRGRARSAAPDERDLYENNHGIGDNGKRMAELNITETLKRNVANAWMKDYDEKAFAISPPRPIRAGSFTGTADSDLQLNRQTTASSNSLLSASLTEQEQVLGSSARPPPSTNFHKIMSERGQGSRIQDASERLQVSLTGRSNRPSPEELYSHQSLSKILNNSDRRMSSYEQQNNQRSSSPRNLSSLKIGKQGGASRRASIKRSDSMTESVKYQSSSGDTIEAKALEKKGSTKEKPTGWLSRHISFGGLGFTAQRVSAGTAISTDESAFATLATQSSQPNMLTTNTKTSSNSRNDKPTQPIAIRSGSRAEEEDDSSQKKEAHSASISTLKDAADKKTTNPNKSQADLKDSSSLFLFAASKGLRSQVGPKPDILSTSGGGPELPKMLDATQSLAPWLVLVNPCNPTTNKTSVANQFRRWQHVFPRPLRASDMKWKSLSSPASVPLTNEYFPSEEQIRNEYHESLYRINQNDEDDFLEVPMSREALIREMIGFRLSHGFQVVVSHQGGESITDKELSYANIFDESFMSHDGDVVFMSVGNTIHQLSIGAGGDVEVKRYHRKPTVTMIDMDGVNKPMPYRPYIRTALEKSYQLREITLKPLGEEYNWNFIDNFLAGYNEEFTDMLRFWRTRFVLIPVDIPTGTRRPLPMLTEDSEEEVRLEGIRKLTQLWQRHRYVSLEERLLQNDLRKGKDPNPLAIEYQTRDPSAIVAANPDSAVLGEKDMPTSILQIHQNLETWNTSNIEISKLASELQGEKGIPIVDRRWHWRLHYNCFVGFDLVSWLFQHFSDIESRDDAVELGNKLMKQGLFQHVQRKHQFRDGNFFFQIASEYRASRPDSRAGWFGSRRLDKSVPSTPFSEMPKSTLGSRDARAKVVVRPGTRDSSSSSSALDEGEKTPTKVDTPKKSVMLSHSMRYDVDSRKRSYRPEIINLHYDRLHNPDNCYHIRIDWMNVTAKLIEDAVVAWATAVEKYGLKLVELPIAEASSVSNAHPFRAPYVIKLALPPPKQQPRQYFDSSHFAPQPLSDRFIYHKGILRKLNFVLDLEAASAFPVDVEVAYSWGKPEYKYTQYIHKSGVLLAQITNDGDFLLLANRLAHNRSLTSRDTAKFDTKMEPFDRRGRPQGHNFSNAEHPVGTPSERERRSPYASPAIRAVTATDLSANVPLLPPTFPPDLGKMSTQTAEQIGEEVERFCGDLEALRQFYDEFAKRTVSAGSSPSPHILPMNDDKIPTIGLPPAILVRDESRTALRRNVSGDVTKYTIGGSQSPASKEG